MSTIRSNFDANMTIFRNAGWLEAGRSNDEVMVPGVVHNETAIQSGHLGAIRLLVIFKIVLGLKDRDRCWRMVIEWMQDAVSGGFWTPNTEKDEHINIDCLSLVDFVARMRLISGLQELHFKELTLTDEVPCASDDFLRKLPGEFASPSIASRDSRTGSS
ncbi:hypothetical protein SCHPADRAFT_896845 [Schizopora paradoxa]|uniref:Uncharacterized protein n=1 Tax=Schizopora paradoxa TaxID=27342 RepID=A0A0H2R095_9AGAM|nr:hypothetical protein SCHPADRAFT_896845 [Schizopora paradoxa]